MIDHLTIRVRDHAASKTFYAAALKPLGYEVLREFDIPGYGELCGLGVEGKPELWLAVATDEHPTPTGQHLALRGRSRAEVAAFHAAALAAGARDDGAPGPRPEYHPSYYAAFVIDLNGIRLEACTHQAE